MGVGLQASLEGVELYNSPKVTVFALVGIAVVTRLLHVNQKGKMELRVEWGSTNTGWHINVHHVKNFYTHEV